GAARQPARRRAGGGIRVGGRGGGRPVPPGRGHRGVARSAEGGARDRPGTAMSGDFFGGGEVPAMVKAVAAALAGRILRLASVQGRPALTWGTVVSVVMIEAPLVGAFGLLGWHAASLFGLENEDARVVCTTL